MNERAGEDLFYLFVLVGTLLYTIVDKPRLKSESNVIY
jgi:hypothetical protein